jgi:hypothetical protein
VRAPAFLLPALRKARELGEVAVCGAFSCRSPHAKEAKAGGAGE